MFSTPENSCGKHLRKSPSQPSPILSCSDILSRTMICVTLTHTYIFRLAIAVAPTQGSQWTDEPRTFFTPVNLLPFKHRPTLFRVSIGLRLLLVATEVRLRAQLRAPVGFKKEMKVQDQGKKTIGCATLITCCSIMLRLGVRLC